MNYLDPNTGDVYIDGEKIGNAGEGPYLLEEDIMSVVVSEQLPNDSAPVKGKHLKESLSVLCDDMEYGTPTR